MKAIALAASLSACLVLVSTAAIKPEAPAGPLLARTSAKSVRFPDVLYRDGALARNKAALDKPGGYGYHPKPGGARAADLAFFESDILLNNDVVAYYGSPNSDVMGILGAYPIEKLGPMLESLAKEYDALNGDRGVVPAFYLIYGTVWPGGAIGYLSDDVVKKYVEYALERRWLVYLDHQLGRYGVGESVDKLLRWLRYPNVQLAIDPEWHTDKPMREIGSITWEELNDAQRRIADYMSEQGMPGWRQLVVHQFKTHMIQGWPKVKADMDPVVLVHCADGFGAPEVKRQTYAWNASVTTMPIKSFKLFYKSHFELAGFDHPLMSPEEVMRLKPRPQLIMYQ
jgi:hypothetical protein